MPPGRPFGLFSVLRPNYAVERVKILSFQTTIFGKAGVHELLARFGSPLYVYDESTLRQACRDLKQMMKYERFRINYSVKANCNVELLRIINEEGLDVDAMSPGEMLMEFKAGFAPERIMFIGNNVSREEFQYAVDRGIYISVDSLSQLETLGELNPGGEVCLRINTEIGAGHHQKVVTGGKKAKFGIALNDLEKARETAARFNLTITGVNHHIGSLFLDPAPYLQAAERLLEVAALFPTVETVDFGGGFGIPYRHGEEQPLDLASMGAGMDALIAKWVSEHWPITVRCEPGRYVPVRSGILLGTVTSVKKNYDTHFIGTDIGFNVLARPVMYDSYHEITVAPRADRTYELCDGPVYVVGNICESGDILAHDRPFPRCIPGDALIVHDAGAYGFAMASSYNCRPLPAEVIIEQNGEARLIRRRQTLEELWPGV